MTPPVNSLNEARVSKASRIKDLEAEVERLKRALTPNGPINHTLETWELMPIELRDRFAVEAIYQCNGNETMALIQLGFQIKSTGKNNGQDPAHQAERNLFVERVLNTPGVQVLLRKNLEDAEEHRRAIMARQVAISLHGTPDQSIRATQNVAKLAAWLKDEGPTQNNQINVFTLAGDGSAQRMVSSVIEGEARPALGGTDPMSLLAHVPGKPVRIDSGSEAIDALLANAPIPDDDDIPRARDPEDDATPEDDSPNVSMSNEEHGWL